MKGPYVSRLRPACPSHCPGTGRSTSTRLTPRPRFYDPVAGEIAANGTAISAFALAPYRRALALVAQEPSLFAGTVRENILLGLEEEAAPAGEAGGGAVAQARRVLPHGECPCPLASPPVWKLAYVRVRCSAKRKPWIGSWRRCQGKTQSVEAKHSAVVIPAASRTTIRLGTREYSVLSMCSMLSA